MKIIRIYKPGSYDQLKIEEAETPTPGKNQVLVKIESTGLNYADIIIRWGLYASAKKFVGWPITPGFEYAGTVASIGEGVEKWKVGDKVVGCSLFNAYASHILSDPRYIFNIPKDWSFEQAAGMPATFLTAYHALFQNVIIRPGAKVLVHSAAGGVGCSVLQMCRIKGFETIAVVGSSHKVEVAKAFGATHVIDKSKEDLWARVQEIAPQGYDVALDANGVSTLGNSFKYLGPGGKLMIYGFHSMFPKKGGRLNYVKLAYDFVRTPSFSPLNFVDGNKSIVSFNLSFLWEKMDLLQEAMNDIFKWIEEGQLQAPKVKAFPFDEVGKAHAELESGNSTGKIVLKL